MVRRSTRFLAHVVGAVLAALALAAVALGIRLSAGPLSVDFLTPYVEQALADAAPDYRITVGGSRLSWTGLKHPLDFEVTDVLARDAAGNLVARVPAAAIGFSARALLHGLVAPTSVELRRPDATLMRSVDGAVSLGLTGEGTPPAMGGGILDGIVGDLLKPLGGNDASGYLKRFAISDANLVLLDAKSGKTWRAPGADISLARDASGISGSLDLPVSVAGRSTHLRGFGRFDAMARRVALNVRVTDLLPAAFGDLDPALAPLAAFGVALSGTANVEIGADARDRKITFDLSGGGGALTLPERYPEPLPIEKLAARGSVDIGASRAVLDQFEMVTRGITFGGNVAVDYGELGLGADGRITFGAIDTATLISLWPLGVAPGGREWIAENMANGRVTGGTLVLKAPQGAFDLSPTPREAVDLAFAYEGLDVHYLGDLPVVRGTRGTGRLDGDSLEIKVDAGTADLGDLGKLEVGQGIIRITEFAAIDQIGDIRLSLNGPATALAGLLDRKPLGYPTRYDIAPSSLGGEASVVAQMRLPLRSDVKVDDLSFDFEGTLSRFSMPPLWRDLEMRNGEIAVKVEPKGLRAKGTASLGGIPARLEWAENFAPAAGQPGTTLDIAATLDAAARARLALPEAERVTGPVPTTLRLTGRGPKIAGITIKADLADAGLDLATAGWTKAAGSPASLDMELRPQAGGVVAFENVTAKADALDVAGRFELDSEGSLARVVLDRARIGANDATLDLSHVKCGPWIAQVRGRALDLAPWQEEQAKKPPGPGRIPDMRIVADVQRVGLRHDVSLDAVSATIETRDNRYRALSIDGRFLGGETLMARIVPRQGGRDLSVRTADAASLIRLLGIYANADGGKLDAQSRIDDTGAVSKAEGRLVIDGFRIRKAPILARILTLGSLTGISDTLQGEGIWFERLEMPFTRDGEVLRMEKARAFGPALGVTADGSVDREHETMSIAGTIVPAYTINSILGRVPLLGTLLTGGEGQGIFGINFSLTGGIAEPQVSVNPLSALAPGILRDIVGVLDGTNAAANATPGPSDAEKPQPKSPGLPPAGRTP